MELWNKARSFAEEAAKRSQQVSFIGTSKLSYMIAETTKEIAAQASKHLSQPSSPKNDVVIVDLESYGITEELREFVKGITITTFEDFPLQDDTELSDAPAVSNVTQDLTEWQEKHANLVLSTVKAMLVADQRIRRGGREKGSCLWLFAINPQGLNIDSTTFKFQLIGKK